MNENPDHTSDAGREVLHNLSDEQLDTFRKYLAGKGPEDPRPCPFCGSREWEVSDLVRYHPASFMEDIDLAFFEPPVASLALACGHCGLLLHFDAARVRSLYPKETTDTDA